MNRHVRVYIEGGAEGRAADSDFRRGWKKFLNELHELARNSGYHSLEVVRGKGRGNAFERFKSHHKNYPDDLCALLVDSETAAPNDAKVWSIVSERDGDHWLRPSWATERHLYLMTRVVETWLLADPDALQLFYKRGFDLKSLPLTDLENRSKEEIFKALNEATKNSPKGSYRHGQAHEIIGTVSPEKVKTLKHGKRLFDELVGLIRGEPEI